MCCSNVTDLVCFAGRRAARDHLLCGRQLGHPDVTDDDAYPAHARETRAGPSVRRASGKCAAPRLAVVTR